MNQRCRSTVRCTNVTRAARVLETLGGRRAQAKRNLAIEVRVVALLRQELASSLHAVVPCVLVLGVAKRLGQRGIQEVDDALLRALAMWVRTTTGPRRDAGVWCS